MDRVVPLRFGVDTLESSCVGELPLSVRGDLEELKDEAINTDTPVLYPLAGHDFFIQPKGFRFHRYLIENELMALRIATSVQIPMLSMRLSAYGLALMGHEALYDLALEAANELGANAEGGLSRLDLALDYQGFVPTREVMDNLRCRMKYRAHHQNGSEGQTFQYGKGPFVLRLYNKTAQVRDKGLEWASDLHTRCPGYDHTQPVYRAEVQYRRAVLKELGVYTVRDAFARLPELFVWGMGEVELRVPQADSTITRWPVDERWAAIRDGVHSADKLIRVRKTPAMLARYEAVNRGLSALTTYAAYYPPADMTTLALRFLEDMAKVLKEEERDFAGLVEPKRRRIGLSGLGEEYL